MEISILDVLGPVMIGPSSSHTAGAVRLARVAAEIAEKPFGKVGFGLSGSFAKTCRGHGTDKALLAGAMGLAPDDERIADAFELAKQRGITACYYEEDLAFMHENSVHITFYHPQGQPSQLWGSSIGGGRILISRIGDYDTKLHAESPTLLVRHLDRPGVLSDVTRELADAALNVGLLRLSRTGRGGQASADIIVDSPVPPQVVQRISNILYVQEVILVDVP